MAKPKTSEAGEALPNPNQRPTRELWRFVDFYVKRIRAHPKEETMGVIRQLQRMVDKGIGLEEIATALENYAEDDWRKAQDPRCSKHIRSFFTPSIIREWLTPRPALRRPTTAVDKVAAFRADFRPAPAVVSVDDHELVEDL